MADFLHLGSSDERRLTRLLEAFPGLTEAPEYLALESDDKHLTFQVAAVAGQYWKRLVEDGNPAAASFADNVEFLAEDPDTGLHDLVVELMFELPAALLERLLLRPRTLALRNKFVRD